MCPGPLPELHAAFVRMVGEPIVLAVGPARPLEHLVALAYTPTPSEDFVLEVEVDTGTDGSVEVNLVAEPASAITADAFDFDIDVTGEARLPPAARPHVPPRTTPRPVAALPVEIRPIAPAPSASRPTLPARHSLESTLAAVADVDELDWLFEVVMAYVATRWSSALLFELHDGTARGRRGHGPKLTEASIRAVTLALSTPSVLQRAHAQRRLVHATPASADEVPPPLAVLLGEPRGATAVVLRRGDARLHALVVGEPRADNPEDAAVDLARLAEAIDDALERIG